MTSITKPSHLRFDNIEQIVEKHHMPSQGETWQSKYVPPPFIHKLLTPLFIGQYKTLNNLPGYGPQLFPLVRTPSS